MFECHLWTLILHYPNCQMWPLWDIFLQTWSTLAHILPPEQSQRLHRHTSGRGCQHRLCYTELMPPGPSEWTQCQYLHSSNNLLPVEWKVSKSAINLKNFCKYIGNSSNSHSIIMTLDHTFFMSQCCNCLVDTVMIWGQYEAPNFKGSIWNYAHEGKYSYSKHLLTNSEIW